MDSQAKRIRARESDSVTQAFLLLYESPYKRFLRGVGTVHLRCGFAFGLDSQAKRIRANSTPIAHAH